MHELIATVAFFTAIPLLIIGWVMSIVAAKRFGTQWVLGMVLVPVFPLTLIMLSLVHWNQAKKPLVVSVIGAALMLVLVAEL